MNTPIEDGFMSEAQTYLDVVVRPGVMRLITKIGLEARDPARLIEAMAEPAGTQTAAALVRMGLPVVPLLTSALAHPNPLLRERAAVALGCIGPPAREAVPQVAAMLRDEPVAPDGHCRACGAAAFALEQIEATDALLALLCSEHTNASRYAGRALGHPESAVRRWAAFGFGQVDGEAAQTEAAALLVRALADDDAAIRRSAAAAVSSLAKRAIPSRQRPQEPPARSAAPALRQHLADPDPATRLEVALALSDLGLPTAQSNRILREAAEDSATDSPSKDRCLQALKHFPLAPDAR